MAIAIALSAGWALAQSDKEPPKQPLPEASLVISSDPPGARIYVGHEGGGRSLHLKGSTPATVTIHSAIADAPQRYRVMLTYPGCDSYSQVFEVRRGDQLNLDVQLDPQCKRAYVQDGSIVVEAYDGLSARRAVAAIGPGFSWDRLEWSPDGRYLAWSEMGEIFVVDVARPPKRQVTDIAGLALRGGAREVWVCSSPKWAPDGRHIACIAHADNDSKLLVVPLRLSQQDSVGASEELWLPGAGTAGAIPTPLEIGANYTDVTAWHPSERILAAEDTSSTLWLVSLSPSYNPLPDATITIPFAAQAVWSPDGSRIAFSAGGVLYLADTRGLAETELARPPAGTARRPVWSPDGEAVAYIVRTEDTPRPREEIHVVPVGRPDLDVCLVGDEGSPFDEAISTLHGFTPDGADVVYSIGDPRSPTVYAVPVGGGAPRELLRNAALLAYSRGLPDLVYRSLTSFMRELRSALEHEDIGRLSELCLPVLERVGPSGEFVEEVYEDTRAAALAQIARAIGPSAVEQSTHKPYAGDDGRFEEVVILGGSGRRLYLQRSEGRWYIGGFTVPVEP